MKLFGRDPALWGALTASLGRGSGCLALSYAHRPPDGLDDSSFSGRGNVRQDAGWCARSTPSRYCLAGCGC
jgi:hypothetical protein